MRSEEPTRLGLVWQSDPVDYNGVPHVVRVVQRGTRLKSTGTVSSLPDELALVVTVVLLPLRLLTILVAGQRYKVGIMRVEGPDDETIVHKEPVRGETAARARASELSADLDQFIGG